MSYALSHPGGENTELVAVLGDGAAGDLDSALAEDVDDGLIGERVLWIFFLDELLQLRLDPTRRDVLPIRSREAGGEEELQRENAPRCLDELLVGDAAHRRFVHVDDFGDFAKRQRLEVLDSLLEEIALTLDDVVHDLEHRLPALLDRLNHPVGGIELVGDELLVLSIEFLLVAGDLLISAAQFQPWQVRIVQEDVVTVVNLLDDQIRDDVVVVSRAVLQSRLGIELGDFVGCFLDVGGADTEPLRDLAPAVVYQLLEAVADEPVRYRLLEAGFLELEKEAFAEVAGTNTRGIETLDSRQHLLSFFHRVERDILDVAAGIFGRLGHHLVESAYDIFNPAREIAVVVNVAYELVREQRFPRSQLEKADLVAKVVAQVARRDGDRLEVFPLLVLLATAAGGVEAIEKDFLPIDLPCALVFGLGLWLLDLGLLVLLFFFLCLDEIEERIVEELLFQVLLEVEQRHVEQIHRLIQARIDLELLPELRRLVETRLHEAATSPLSREKRSRSRAVSVGPR